MMNDHTATAEPVDGRREALGAWLESVLGAPPALTPVASDASFRRYFRLTLADGTTRIAMDAPPEREDTGRFLHVAGLMRAAGVHVPDVFAADSAGGFALLSDLGKHSYLDVLNDGNVDELFDDAVDTLVRWQAATRLGELPAYDAALLRRELDLFPEWFAARHLVRPFDAGLRSEWERLCEVLVARALAQPQVFVHRDFMVRNLMVCEPRPGVIDFQDAVLGPLAYDLLSLFRDAGVSWDPRRIAEWVERYRRKARAARLPAPADADEFQAMFDLIGVQRHLKVAGIFARLAYRDGKLRYLDEVPRILSYLRSVAPHYRECAPLGRILAALEVDC